MHNKIVKEICKSIFLILLTAVIIVVCIMLGIKLIIGEKIETGLMLVSKIAITTNKNKTEEKTIINEEKKSLENYPEYGTQYATIEIPRIDAELPVYFGDTLEILKKGVGHSSGSYFPGEGGSILYMGHNSKKIFRRFSELQIGDEIKITTTYGEYNYKIYDMQLINESDTDKVAIQRDEEILMVYTCYPFNNIGYATQRYVVYAKPEK